MKRYSVSISYGRNRETNKIKYHYFDRTDCVEDTIARYNESLNHWISRVTDENYEYRNQTDDYFGIKITDSQTKKVVFEDYHFSEEYGYKKEFTEVKTDWGGFWKGEWVKV